MSAPPYMKFYVGDYLADTTALTTREHGAYMLLLMGMWRAGGKLPANDAKLAKITKCSPKEWTAIRETMLAFFRRRGSILTHKRLSQEIARAHTVSCNRQRGQKGTDSENDNKDNHKAVADASHLKGKRPHNQNQSKREKDYNSPSPLTPRDKPEARHEGASANRAAKVIDLDELRDRLAAGELS